MEEDIAAMKDKWEDLTNQSQVYECRIAELSGRELILNSEVDRCSARVIELETQLQSKEMSDQTNEDILTETKASLHILQADILQTKQDYEIACQEVINYTH